MWVAFTGKLVLKHCQTQVDVDRWGSSHTPFLAEAFGPFFRRDCQVLFPSGNFFAAGRSFAFFQLWAISLQIATLPEAPILALRRGLQRTSHEIMVRILDCFTRCQERRMVAERDLPQDFRRNGSNKSASSLDRG